MAKQKLHPAEKYAHDIVSGRISACKYVRQAVDRYFRDLKSLPKQGFVFDKKKAAAVIQWVSDYCRHYRGAFAGQPLDLLPWQQFIYWQLFGWVDKYGNRRFKYVYVEVPKKNGKTTGFLAPIGLYMLVGDGEPGPEVYFAAGSRDQASIAFKDVRAMISASPELRQVLQPLIREIKPTKQCAEYGVDNNFQCYPVSSEAGNLDGKNVYFSGMDEFHIHITNEVFNIMSSGMISRQQPIQFTITTAGHNKYGPCYSYRETCLQILSGGLEDESTLTVIYTPDDGDDWQDEKTWMKANPTLGRGKDLSRMRDEYKQKKLQGSTGVNEFKTKQLNMWVDSAVTWIPDEEVKKSMKPEPLPDMSETPCFVGMDLAATRDITAIACAWRKDGAVYARVKYWLPSEVLEERKALNDKHPYIQFAKKGLIQLTPGNVTDYEYIRRDISGVNSLQPEFYSESIAGKYQLQSVGFDNWNATHLISQLTNDGVTVNEVRQGFQAMNYPTKQLEQMILSGMIHFGEDPVLRWMFRNVHLESDSIGNVRPKKKNREKKIDGVMAVIMALSELFRFETENNNFIPDDYKIRTL